MKIRRHPETMLRRFKVVLLFAATAGLAGCSAAGAARPRAPEGAQMAGQNERSFPVVIQYVDDKSYVVWPKSQAVREAVLPLPKGTTFSNQ